MPITYEGYDPRIRRYVASRVRKLSKSPGIGTFFIGMFVGFFVLPIVIPLIGYKVEKIIAKK